MRKIVLFCNAGMSTSLLVNKMKEAAAKDGYEVEIEAHALSEADKYGAEADIVLLGPQVRFNQAKVQAKLPNIPVEVIDVTAYGTMNGKAVIDKVKKALND